MRSKGHQIFTRAHFAVYSVEEQLFEHSYLGPAPYELIRCVSWPSLKAFFIRGKTALWDMMSVRVYVWVKEASY